jgi:hypothetical protein
MRESVNTSVHKRRQPYTFVPDQRKFRRRAKAGSQGTSAVDECPCCGVVDEVSDWLGFGVFYPAFENRAGFVVDEVACQ